MSEKHISEVITVKPRTVVGKAVKKLRQTGWVPAVMYGHGIKPTSLMTQTAAITKVYKEAGNSSLVDLLIEGEKQPVKVIIQSVSTDPLKSDILHVDFYKVNLTEMITTEIPLVFAGMSRAVKEEGAILVKNADHLKVECLPTALVSEITVPLELLDKTGDVILISQIVIPDGIKVLMDTQEVLATVQAPRSEEELASLQEKPVDVAPDAVEVIKKEKKVKDEEASTATPEKK